MSKEFSEEYRAYLASPEWQYARCDMFDLYGRKCAGCGSTRKIQAHHLFYPTPITDTEARHLIPVCKGCHKQLHSQRLFHHTVLQEQYIEILRAKTIKFLQRANSGGSRRAARQFREDAEAKSKAIEKERFEAEAAKKPKSDPKYISLPAMYGPQKKRKRFLSYAEYQEKLPDPWASETYTRSLGKYLNHGLK